MQGRLGLYVHVPFCVSKCAYCDFYSMRADAAVQYAYVQKCIEQLNRWGGALANRPADTLYFGGGTPSLLPDSALASMIQAAKQNFGLTEAEITVEVNPAEQLEAWFCRVAEAGVNRVSIGMQSAVAQELSALSRRHQTADVARTVRAARSAGIRNDSLDVMLGIPGQTPDSLKTTLDYALSLNPSHISAYILTLEKGTPLFEHRAAYNIPDADAAADLYLLACAELEQAGYIRYEISNFAKPGFTSRHNSKYWLGEDYLGIGPAAHSLLDGKRFYYPRSVEAFLNEPATVVEGTGGGMTEYIMLRMRLAQGVSLAEIKTRFDLGATKEWRDRTIKKARRLQAAGLIRFDSDRILLTDRGALVSNAVITELLDCLPEQD